jgi:hypothetical protein
MRHEPQHAAHAGSPRDGERHAFNLAFGEMDLGWHWDEQTWSELQALPTEDERLRAYLRTRHGHLLKAYDADFLVDAIRSTKARCRGESPAHA